MDTSYGIIEIFSIVSVSQPWFLFKFPFSQKVQTFSAFFFILRTGSLSYSIHISGVKKKPCDGRAGRNTLSRRPETWTTHLQKRKKYEKDNFICHNGSSSYFAICMFRNILICAAGSTKHNSRNFGSRNTATAERRHNATKT